MARDNLEPIKVVYRPDGCVDFCTTKAIAEGTALTQEELEEINLSYSSKVIDILDDDFWGDPCFTEPLWSNPK